MSFDHINERGLVLLGCGRMGSALLEGWLKAGMDKGAVSVIDPHPSDWVKATGVTVNGDLPKAPAVVLIAVKPQMMGDALPQIAAFGGGDTVFLSIAAGTLIRRFEETFGGTTPVVRAMPNTPAAIGRGITAITGNDHAGTGALDMAEALLSVVGDVVRLDGEGQMDAVTGLSGSGPAYIFHLIEAMAAAGQDLGLAPDLAMRLARATVTGAAALADQSDETATKLRENVTSPNGTTQAALEVLMNDKDGFPPLLKRAIRAAADRSRELSQ